MSEIVDKFSKFAMLIPCKVTIDAQDTVQLFSDGRIQCLVYEVSLCPVGTPSSPISLGEPFSTTLAQS